MREETKKKVSMTTTQRLLDAAESVWNEYLNHPFVLGIQNGTLSKKQFRYYIIQDYLYLEEYVRVFALGLAKATNLETRRLFALSIANLTGEEMDLHRGYMGRFAVSREELGRTPRALDNLSYTSYMIRVAYEEGEAETLAAVLSCAYSYEIIAKMMLERNPSAADDPLFGAWVRGYANKTYSEANRKLLKMTNSLTAQYSELQLKHLEDIFVACSRYELAFWDLAWNMGSRRPELY